MGGVFSSSFIQRVSSQSPLLCQPSIKAEDIRLNHSAMKTFLWLIDFQLWTEGKHDSVTHVSRTDRLISEVHTVEMGRGKNLILNCEIMVKY